jgi:hypothetical protein
MTSLAALDLAATCRSRGRRTVPTVARDGGCHSPSPRPESHAGGGAIKVVRRRGPLRVHHAAFVVGSDEVECSNREANQSKKAKP